jgi:uncharacterized radical SAM superfamily Fe-S cluster-containing enzyme
MNSMKILEKTQSVCPLCFHEGAFQRIDANIIEDQDAVWIQKTCPKHGSFRELYFGDKTLYERWMKYKVTGNTTPEVKRGSDDAPELYSNHVSQTVLTNIIITNRSNSSCVPYLPDASHTGYVYEPSLEHLKTLMGQTRSEKPIGSSVLQITGGEPTLRDDLPAICSLAKQTGFTHVQVRTNGLLLAENPEYCRSLKNAQVDTIYLQFNGISKATNPRIEQQKKTIENCRRADLSIVLVPFLIGERNGNESGRIVRFAFDNIDIVRGVHFEPFFSSGASTNTTDTERKAFRVDYGRILESIEQEYPGMISRDDFYPTSFVYPVGKLVEVITMDPQIELSPHPGCGGSTFVFLIEGKPVPLTRFADVEGTLKFLSKQIKKKGPLRKLRIASSFMKNIDTFVDFKKAPPGFNPKQILKDATIMGSNYALREFRRRTLSIGFMGYQDVWNMDLDRLRRCVIHYSTPEGIIPFCMFHGLGYGEKIMKKHGIPVHEWEHTTGRSLSDDQRKDQ